MTDDRNAATPDPAVPVSAGEGGTGTADQTLTRFIDALNDELQRRGRFRDWLAIANAVGALAAAGWTLTPPEHTP